MTWPARRVFLGIVFATPGQIVAERFEIERHVGSGGMGVVYRAIDRQTKAPAALKLVHGAGEARFEREARLLGELSHPHIVSYVAHGKTGDGLLYLAMEWLDGEDLATRLQVNRLSPAETLALAKACTSALAVAHARGIVHRDIKPSNLYLVDWKPERTKLLDFGIARLLDVSGLTQSGAILGTPLYMAPEQVLQRNIDARADIFALGAVLFECLTGRPPFPAESLPALVAMLMSSAPAPRASSLAPATPPALDALVARMLSKDPNERPRDASEIADLLERLDLSPGLAAAETQFVPSAADPSVDDLLARGKAALAEVRWSDARDAFERALAKRDGPEVRMFLANAHWWLGAAETSIEHYRQAYAMLRRSDEPRAVLHAARVALVIAATYKKSFDNDAACRGWVARASRLLGEKPGPLHGMLWCIQGLSLSDPKLAAELFHRALELARATKQHDSELIALASLGASLVAMGDVERGLAHIDESMAGIAGGEFEQLDAIVPATCSMVVACDQIGDAKRMIEWCRAANQLHGAPLVFSDCRGRYGSALVHAGDWAEAERELVAARDASSTASAFRNYAVVRLADLRLRQGRVDDAARILSTIGDVKVARPIAAALEHARGNHALAVELLRRFINGAGSNVLDAVGPLDLLVDASIAAGDRDTATSATSRLEDLGRSIEAPIVRAHAAFAKGRFEQAYGSIEAAREALEHAADLFAAANAPHESARARLALAELLAKQNGDLAANEARSARATFERLGASRDMAAASELLVTLGR